MDIVRSGRDTMLVAGVPQRRGTPIHFEHDESENLAFTTFNDRTNKVEEIHTPRNVALIRIHELMHARHTDNKRYKKAYKPVEDIVGQIIEDVRIHVCFWPWPAHKTPESIVNAVRSYMRSELDKSDAKVAADPTRAGDWGDFATRLRVAAVVTGVNRKFDFESVRLAHFATEEQVALAYRVIDLVRHGREGEAAYSVGMIFNKLIPPPPKPLSPDMMKLAGGAGTGYSTDFESPILTINGYAQPSMKIIELDKTEACEGASIGTRRATMGSRMYRPALRRPLLPQRLFLRRTPVEPGGTILIDASGSMGDFAEISQWAEKAPFGTIAYYAGNGSSGWLWIYARDGRRAKEVEEPHQRGNTVDGPALTWLMSQPAPRTFVTDRGFCDAVDSEDQKARLRELERTNQVRVVNYNTEDAD